MSDERDDLKVSKEEEAEIFSFGDKTLDDYEEEATIPKGEYVLEVQDFKRGVKVYGDDITDDQKKQGRSIGDKVPWASVTLRHRKDKNGKIEPKLMGRRYDVLLWDLATERARDEAGDLYRTLGFGGSYVPKYSKEEFIRGNGETETRAFGTFYIGRYQDSQSKRFKNSNPKPVNDTKSKKQEAKDAKGPVEL